MRHCFSISHCFTCRAPIQFCLTGRQSHKLLHAIFGLRKKIRGLFKLPAIKERNVIQCSNWRPKIFNWEKLKPHVGFCASNSFPHKGKAKCQAKKKRDLQCSKSGHTLEANAQAIVENVCTVANYPSSSDSFAQLRGLGRRKPQLYWYQCKPHC